MEPFLDESVFYWISDGRNRLKRQLDQDFEPTGNTVRHLMPNDFEAYAKIFHSIECNFENIDNPLSAEELAILKISDCAQLRSLIKEVRARRRGLRIRWQEIAHTLHLPFAPGLTDDWFRTRLEPGCWPRYVFGPAEGYLEPDEYAQLTSLLLEESNSAECF